MSNVETPTPLLPSFKEAGEVCGIGVRVAGVVGRQRYIGAAQREVRILTQTGGNFAGPGGGDMLLAGKKSGILGPCQGNGLLQGQRDPRRLRRQERAG